MKPQFLGHSAQSTECPAGTTGTSCLSPVTWRLIKKAKDAAKACLTTLPNTRMLGLDRVPLKDRERMAELRDRLRKDDTP